MKHVHISGRWSTSRQPRFRRYVQGSMRKVMGRQRIKHARSAREDSSTSIYNCGPISAVQGSKAGISQIVAGDKIDF